MNASFITSHIRRLHVSSLVGGSVYANVSSTNRILPNSQVESDFIASLSHSVPSRPMLSLLCGLFNALEKRV